MGECQVAYGVKASGVSVSERGLDALAGCAFNMEFQYIVLTVLMYVYNRDVLLYY